MGAKTAKQQDALTELLDLLTQNGKKQEAAELSALFSQFATMETQYGKVLSELAAVREQLATLHDGGNRAAAMQETKQTQAHITQAKETLSTLKENMTDKIRKTLAAIAMPLKRHKATLEGMEKNIDRAMARLERLEQAAAKGKEKPSIREEIKAAAAKLEQPKKKAPQKAQEAAL